MVSQTYPSGRVVKNVYDSTGDLLRVFGRKTNSPEQTYASEFKYTAFGALSQTRLGNNRWESTQFNSRLQPTQIALGTTANATDLLKLEYDYGTQFNNGNVLQQKITVPNMAAPFVQTYVYDSLNRLQSATETNNSTQIWKQTFTFDRYGNRRFDMNNTTVPDNQQLPKVVNPEILTSNNRFKLDQDNDGVNDYLYDAAGNLTQDATGKRFVYDAENKQRSFGTGGSDTNGGQYFYDGDGRRVKKVLVSTNETTIFVYNASGQLVAEYTINAQAITNPETRYLTSDTLGSPRIITSQNGEVKERHDYMPFGEELLIARSGQGYGSEDKVRQKFTSQQRDSESGLDYFLTRYYSSTTGRFTSPDSFMASAKSIDPQTFNRYVYVTNNPLRYIDPDGMDGQSAWDLLTKQEQDLIARKLAYKTVGEGKNARKQTPREAFGDLLRASKLDGADAISYVVDAFRSMLDITGARTNGEIWNALYSIDYLQGGGENKGNRGYNIGFMFSTQGTDNAGNPDKFFTKLLERNNYVINMEFRIAGVLVATEQDLAEWGGHEPHKWSARYITKSHKHVVPHWVQNYNYRPNKFDLHFDPENSACTDCSYFEQKEAAESHGRKFYNSENQRYLMQRDAPKTGLKMTKP
jgi:RHS repeat-associated protein